MSMKNGTICTYCGRRMTMHPSGICSQCRRLSCTKPCKAVKLVAIYMMVFAPHAAAKQSRKKQNAI